MKYLDISPGGGGGCGILSGECPHDGGFTPFPMKPPSVTQGNGMLAPYGEAALRSPQLFSPSSAVGGVLCNWTLCTSPASAMVPSMNDPP